MITTGSPYCCFLQFCHHERWAAGLFLLSVSKKRIGVLTETTWLVAGQGTAGHHRQFNTPLLKATSWTGWPALMCLSYNLFFSYSLHFSYFVALYFSKFFASACTRAGGTAHNHFSPSAYCSLKPSLFLQTSACNILSSNEKTEINEK